MLNKMSLWKKVGLVNDLWFPQLLMAKNQRFFADDDGGGGGAGKDDDGGGGGGTGEGAGGEGAGGEGGGGEGEKGWDKDRQHADEIRAAQAREQELNESLSTAQAELEAAQEQLAQQEAAAAAAKAKADSDKAGVEQHERDLDDYGNMIEEVKDQRELIEKLNKQLSSQNDLLSQHQKLVEENKQQLRQEEGMLVINNVCDELEKANADFSAGDRNEVLEKCNAAFIEANIVALDQKQQKLWIERNLRLEYIDAGNLRLKQKKESYGKGKTGVTVDTGQGGERPSDEIKPGTPKEVHAQMIARAKRHGG